MTTNRVAIIGGNRIPFARSNGPYAHASDQDMLTATLDGLVERFGLEGERLDEVVAGAVLKHSRDRDLTREAVLGSKLAPNTPAYDIQRACGTGLETVIAVANKIALRIGEYRARMEALVTAALHEHTESRAVEPLSVAIFGAAEALGRWWLRTGELSAERTAELLIRTIEPGLRNR